MATGTIPLPPSCWVIPDGSANNVGPGVSLRKGSQTGKQVHYLTLDFDGAGSTVEHAWVTFPLPSNYASGGSLKVWWGANGTSNAVKLQAQVGATTAGDADTPLEHALAAAATVTTNVNTTEARRETLSTITLTMDSAAADDTVSLVLFRDPGDGSDTSTADCEVRMVAFDYTTT